MMIAVRINGEERHLAQSTILQDYVDTLGVDLDRIAVAHNGVVLRRKVLSSVTLSEGDQVEIVHAVGGG